MCIARALENILTKCYGVYERAEDIDFDSLPNQFVMKNTLGGGGKSVILVKDKQTFDIEGAKTRMQKWVNTPAHIRGGGREWPYYNGKNRRIIIEEMLTAEEACGGLVDYKFFCFNGEVAFVYVIQDRKLAEHGSLAIMNKAFERMAVQSLTQGVLQETPKKPENYEKMVAIAEMLSADFPHVRVDLYNIQGDIFFGELTFFGASGYMQYTPDEADYTFGEMFQIECYCKQ